MKQIGVLLATLACMVAYAPFAAADLASEPLQPPTQSLSEQPPPEDEQFRPPWADPYALQPDIGVNDDPTPFNPSGTDSNSRFGN